MQGLAGGRVVHGDPALGVGGGDPRAVGAVGRVGEERSGAGEGDGAGIPGQGPHLGERSVADEDPQAVRSTQRDGGAGARLGP